MEKTLSLRTPAAPKTQRKRKLSELKEMIEQVCLMAQNQFVECARD